MKKILELALINASVEMNNIKHLINVLDEECQESAVLILTGNYEIPEHCAIGTKGIVGYGNNKNVGSVYKIDELHSQVYISYSETYNDGSTRDRTTYCTFNEWKCKVEEYISKNAN